MGRERVAEDPLMLSDVRYSDYVALICAFDSEWSRPRFDCGYDELSPFAGVFEQFTTTCWSFREALCHYLKRIRLPGGKKKERPPEPHLFNPMCFVPFGHSDAIGLVLIDDCEIAHHVADSATTTIESLSLGFCPDLGSLGIEKNDPLFRDLDEMLKKGGQVLEPKDAASERAKEDRGGREEYTHRKYRPAVHAFEESTPLLVFSKFKMHGLGTIGPGLLFQQALFRAMVHKVRDIVDILREEVEKQEKTSVGALMAREQIDATKVTFLDLQGSQEIGTLIFCSNYSVAASILAGLRSLTYGVLLSPEIDRRGMLRRALDTSAAHRAITYHAQESFRRHVAETHHPAGNPHPLDKLHVFRWTHSSVSVAWNTFANTPQGPPDRWGYVEAVSEFQVAPGHRVNAEGGVRTTARESPLSGMAFDGPINYRRYLMGTADLPFAHDQAREIADVETDDLADTSVCRLLPLTDVIGIAREYLRTFGCARRDSNFGRDVTGCSTSIVVPIPKVSGGSRENPADRLCGKRDESAHFAPLTIVLRETQQRLCYPENGPETDEGGLGPEKNRRGRLSLPALYEECRKYGLPVSLRRTIKYLYRSFATLIADPFLFDVMLDLYDSFATLHTVLTEHYPLIQQPVGTGSGQPRRHLLNRERVEEISRMVDAIHNAFEHRMFGAYREPPFRETAFDFRGGLNQMLFAADVPTKCGLGLLSTLVQPKSHSGQRNTVGVPTRIEFVPGATAYSFSVTSPKGRARLGLFGGDVPHVLNVSQYSDYFHEAFHLIFDEIREQKQREQHWPLKVFNDAEMLDRLSDVFAIFSCQLFLCGCDVESFRRHCAISYSKSVASVGNNDKETMILFAEWLIELFLATDVLADREDIDEAIRNDPARWGENGWTTREGDDLDETENRFFLMMHEVGPFFYEYDRFWQGENWQRLKSFCRAEFRDIFRLSKDLLPPLWKEGMAVYRRFVNFLFPGGPLVDDSVEGAERDRAIAQALQNPDQDQARRYGEYRQMLSDVDRAAKSSMEEARAVLRKTCCKAYRRGEDDALDPTLLVCTMMRHYIYSSEGAKGRLHLDRDPESGNIRFDPSKEYSEHLIDRCAASRFSAIPSARRRRLRKQIAVLKTFWDISSCLRARRLAEIMRDNWPEVPDMPTDSPASG